MNLSPMKSQSLRAMMTISWNEVRSQHLRALMAHPWNEVVACEIAASESSDGTFLE